MKRKMALVLSAVMASSCLSVTGYAANFKDINDVPWDGAKTVINSVADLGILNGYEDNTFRARNNVTYCEAMHMVYTLLEKTGVAKTFMAEDHYKFIAIMDAYKIPQWAQRAVAYGLNFNILTMDDVAKFTTNGKQNAATRQDVAKMFGQAFAVRYDVNRTATEASKFNDAFRISDDSILLVDLLVRLGVITGDTNNNFLPTNNINRAEMAVMLNKSHELFKNGAEMSGEITRIERLEGDSEMYDITIKMDTGETRAFYASSDRVDVFVGDAEDTVSLSRLSVGDKVGVVRNGDALVSLRLTSATTSQKAYDLTGYISTLKSGDVVLENENSGEDTTLKIDDNCIFYLNKERMTKLNFEKALEENTKGYAYAGVNTKTLVEKEGSSQVENTYAIEIYVTFTDEYTQTGTVTSIDSSALNYKATESSARVTTNLEEGCELYIGDKKASITEMKNMVDNGTTYVKVTMNKGKRAIKIIFAEDNFALEEVKTSHTYKVEGFTESKLLLDENGTRSTISFGSTNPTGNITFYTWDDDGKDWYTASLKEAVRYYDNNESKGTVYCRMNFNSGGKMTKLSLSTKKSAFNQSEDGTQVERKGTIESINGDMVKFKTSSTEYKLLPQYNVLLGADQDTSAPTGSNPNGSGTVKNPLTITGVPTSSLTVFKRLAGASDVAFYCEIQVDGNNNIQKIDGKLTAATGKLISYDPDPDNGDDPEITIQTSDGSEITLLVVNRPSMGSEDYTIDNVASTAYVGSKVELGFGSDGIVRKITVTENSLGGARTVKGIAVSGKNGLEVEGDDTVYSWANASKMNITNHSMPSKSLDRIISLIEDDDIEVYIQAGINDSKKAENVHAYVRKAEGEFVEYDKEDDIIRIKTSDGNEFGFNVVSKPSINISGIAENRLNYEAVGKSVTVEFDTDGSAKSIKN